MALRLVSTLLFTLWASSSIPVASFAPLIVSSRRAFHLSARTEQENKLEPLLVNGDSSVTTNPDLLGDVEIDESDFLPQAPALSFRKYLTMQERRVVVTIQYSADAGWKPYFLTVAKKLKLSHPDIIIERRIMPKRTEDEAEIFKIRVDGKVVVGNRLRKLRPEARSVYVSMVELDLAVSRARRQQRPSSVYGISEETR